VLLRGPLVTSGRLRRAARTRRAAHGPSGSVPANSSPSQGEPVDVGPARTAHASGARVRLAARIEVMLRNRTARAETTKPPYSLDPDHMPPPLDARRAAELVGPLGISRDHMQAPLATFDPVPLRLTATHSCDDPPAQSSRTAQSPLVERARAARFSACGGDR
jgi:hypothetical protein